MKTTHRSTIRTLGAIVIALVSFAFAAAPAGAAKAEEVDFYNATNSARAANGLGALQYDPAASTVAANWSARMASVGTLSHNPNLANEVSSTVTNQWTRLGENVGVGGDVNAIQNAFMNSSGHRANILGAYNRVGVGTARDGSGRLWVTVVFLMAPALNPAPGPTVDAPVAPPSPVQWHLRNATTGGSPDTSFAYGGPGNFVLSCDWDGNGTDTIGVFANGNWYLRNSNTGGAPDIAVSFGTRGYYPICGDWDGNGTDTIGVFVNGNWYLRNSNSAGPPDLAFAYGAAGYEPVVGNWDGSGGDGVGVYVNGNWYLRNAASAGGPNASFAYGTRGYDPIVGNWDGVGGAGVAVVVGNG